MRFFIYSFFLVLFVSCKNPIPSEERLVNIDEIMSSKQVFPCIVSYNDSDIKVILTPMVQPFFWTKDAKITNDTLRSYFVESWSMTSQDTMYLSPSGFDFFQRFPHLVVHEEDLLALQNSPDYIFNYFCAKKSEDIYIFSPSSNGNCQNLFSCSMYILLNNGYQIKESEGYWLIKCTTCDHEASGDRCD